MCRWPRRRGFPLFRRLRTSPELRAAGGGGPLARVERYEIGPAVIQQTLAAVAAAGADGDELFVAWGAEVACGGATARITSVLVPRQRCLHTASGMLVEIDDAALFELNRAFHAAGEVLAGQAHAHPGRAYHSAADDGLAITPFSGSLSLVLPDFARGGRRTERRWRWYRREEDRSWQRLDAFAVEIG